MHRLTLLRADPVVFDWLVRNWARAESFPQLVKLALELKHSTLGTCTERILEVVGQTLQFSEISTHQDISGEWAQIMHMMTYLRGL
jgi:hypothetical protein